MTVFVDTSAIYAFVDRDDRRHQEAVATFRRLVGTEALLTHSYVLVETAALVLRRVGIEGARQLVVDVEPALDVVWVDAYVHRAATAAMLASGSRSISLVDWTSFAIMRTYGIDTAFAFDEDFERQGFTVIG